MNRRGFFARLSVFATGVAAWALVPSSVKDRSKRPHLSLPNRFHFSPYGDLDFIDLPSDIVHMESMTPDALRITCVDGVYMLFMAGPQETWMLVKRSEINGPTK